MSESSTLFPEDRGGRIEWGLAALVLAAGVWALWRFSVLGYLPQPFHYAPSETLSDLFKPAWWAHHGGGYEAWREIYPPLSPVFIRLFSLPGCYAAPWPDGWMAARACDWPLRAMLAAFFLANGPLVWLVLRRAKLAAWPRTAALCLGLPMLYALDRGNLLIPCFTFLLIAEGGIAAWPAARWIAMGLALNLKPYLLVVAPGRLARRDWAWLFGVGAAGLAIYLATLVLEGEGAPFQLVRNVIGYGQSRTEGPHYWASLYFASSYLPLAHMAPAGFSFTRHLGADGATALRLAIFAVIRAAQLGGAACVIAACFRPSRVNALRFGALLAGLALTTFTTGSAGYAEVFVVFLVFLEPWRGRWRPVILVAAYLLCVPFDVAIWPVRLDAGRAFLSGRFVEPHFGVSFGQLVRPGLMLVIQFGLTALNLQDMLAREPQA
jgi:hypothetical protein